MKDMYRFLVIIEKGDHSYGAYSPDLPGCVAVGGTREEAEANMRGAMLMHLRGIIEDREPIPTSQAIAEYMDISIPGSAA
ncbi:MAG: type II toxin-antitoxin system HicB family antitoxin [Ktedonobacteraceae bacterium]